MLIYICAYILSYAFPCNVAYDMISGIYPFYAYWTLSPTIIKLHLDDDSSSRSSIFWPVVFNESL